MRAALWFLALFGVAVAAALFAGNNQGTVTVFWPPYRIDLSLNLVLLLLAGTFFVLHVALRALSALLALPHQARGWRAQRLERAMNAGLLDALSHLTAGRFIRARKAAEGVAERLRARQQPEDELLHADRLGVIAHLLAAESAHALQDRGGREEHVRQAMTLSAGRDAAELREGLQLRAARWAFDDRDIPQALQRLQELPQGAARRTLALRLRFRVARLARHTQEALETARLLAKHRAFSETAARSIARGLALELVLAAHDPAQLQQVWARFDANERAMPEVAVEAADRLLELKGDVALALQWLLPIWEQMVRPASTLLPDMRTRLALTLESAFAQGEAAPDTAWLARIESEQMRQPGDALLQYLAGMVCMRLALWGKAQTLLRQSLGQLKDARLRRRAWSALATLAEQREDAAASLEAWRNAARE